MASRPTERTHRPRRRHLGWMVVLVCVGAGCLVARWRIGTAEQHEQRMEAWRARGERLELPDAPPSPAAGRAGLGIKLGWPPEAIPENQHPPAKSNRLLGQRALIWTQPTLSCVQGPRVAWAEAERVLATLEPPGDEERLCRCAPLDAAAFLADAMEVELHRDRPAAAAARLRPLLDLVANPSGTASLAAHLERLQLAVAAVDATWQALQYPGWNEQELAEWQHRLEQVDLRQSLVRSLERERSLSLQEFQRWQDEPIASAWLWRRLFLWADLDRHLEWVQANLDAAREFADGAPWSELRPDLVQAQERAEAWVRGRWHLTHAFTAARMQRPMGLRIAGQTAVAETWRQMAVVALALARHRQVHGALPARLRYLTSWVPPAELVDPMAPQRFRYLVDSNSSAGMRLHSVGADGRDDAGHTLVLGNGPLQTLEPRTMDMTWPEPLGKHRAPAGETLLPRVHFEEAQLSDVIKTLARQAGINLLFDPRIEDRLRLQITLEMEDVTAREVLTELLSSCGLRLDEDLRTRITRVTFR